ncbi:hypothetical protein KY362_06130 [Candidatus Woesearchaeota archaeon]|nr:hypothetical protein [Candidatus Woesearchaeota archaeon]
MTNPTIVEQGGCYSERQLDEYLQDKGIEKVKDSIYRVPGGCARDEAMDKMCELSGDMMMEFDTLPTAVDGTGGPVSFANSIGFFYIDDIVE